MQLSSKNTRRPRIIYGLSTDYRWKGFNPFHSELPKSKTEVSKKNYKKYKGNSRKKSIYHSNRKEEING